MDRLLLRLQVTVLAIGTAFAWFALVSEFRRFFRAGAHLLDWSECELTNPLLTPCFYTGLAFLAAFVWAFALLRSAPEALGGGLHGLNWLLAAGAVFAWSNFGYDLFLYGQHIPPSGLRCPVSGEHVVPPPMSPCLYGSLIFPAALAISLLMSRTRS